MCRALHRDPVKEKRQEISLTAWLKARASLFYLLFYHCRPKSSPLLHVIKLMGQSSWDSSAASSVPHHALLLKGSFCLQLVLGSEAHFTIERMTLRQTCTGLCRGEIMNVIAETFYEYFHVDLHQDFSSLCLLVITGLRWL